MQGFCFRLHAPFCILDMFGQNNLNRPFAAFGQQTQAARKCIDSVVFKVPIINTVRRFQFIVSVLHYISWKDKCLEFDFSIIWGYSC